MNIETSYLIMLHIIISSLLLTLLSSRQNLSTKKYQGRSIQPPVAHP